MSRPELALWLLLPSLLLVSGCAGACPEPAPVSPEPELTLPSPPMVLEGRYVQPDRTTQQMLGTWTALDDGRVRQHFETSADGGETWVTWFEGFYTRE